MSFFNAIHLVEIYQKALDLLADPKWAKADVVLHDYDEKCYRTDPKYTLNGLHWGYPRDVVWSVTGEDPEGTMHPNPMAWFADVKAHHYQPNARKWPKENSRYSVVKYSEVREIIELGIRQKLADAENNATAERKTAAIWDKKVKTKFKKYLLAAIRIDVAVAFTKAKGDTLTVTVLKPERFTWRGFGVFLENIKRGDVSVSQQALEILARIPERRGLQMMDFFDGGVAAKDSQCGRGPILAGMLRLQTHVPIEHMSVCSDVWNRKLVKLVKVET